MQLTRDVFPRITMDDLLAAIPFEQRSVTVYGKTHPQPRLTKWFGPKPYTYSGLTWPVLELPPLLDELRVLTEDLTHAKFDCVLANLYRNGEDTVGWHSDNEALFGRPEDVEVASLSFGAARTFKMRRIDKTQSLAFELTHGSLLFMPRGTQNEWLHCLPRSKTVSEPRINLTFRRCV